MLPHLAIHDQADGWLPNSVRAREIALQSPLGIRLPDSFDLNFREFRPAVGFAFGARHCAVAHFVCALLELVTPLEVRRSVVPTDAVKVARLKALRPRKPERFEDEMVDKTLMRAVVVQGYAAIPVAIDP